MPPPAVVLDAQVAIVTSEPLGSAELVLDVLRDRGADVLLLDPSDTSLEVTHCHDGSVIVQTSASRCRLGPTTGCWSWHPRFASEGELSHVEPAYRDFTRRSLRAAWRSLLSTPFRWLNDYRSSVEIGSDKLRQARLAQAAGLESIPTVITNAPEQFLRLYDDWNVPFLAVKSLIAWHGDVSDLGTTHATYTRRLSRRDAKSLAARVAACPLIVQPYVEKQYELRCTIVGEEIFVCRIDSQASARTVVDWRHYDFEQVAHTVAAVDGEVRQGLLNLMKACHLRYAAVDMIVDLAGRHVFVEINPSGQFGWIEALTELPISARIADELLLAQP